MENQIIDTFTKPSLISDLEAFNICLQIESQIINLIASKGKVQETYLQYKVIAEELKFLSEHYKGQSLNDVLENLVKSFNNLEKQVNSNLNTYKTNYGDPNKIGDGYAQ